MNKRYFWGGLVLLIGAILLLEAMGILSGNIWRYLWAILLIVIGFGIMFPDK
ncbi:MAG: DUF5668 domain-containing protein [Candidatus Margulisiibacteriota bacterium]